MDQTRASQKVDLVHIRKLLLDTGLYVSLTASKGVRLLLHGILQAAPMHEIRRIASRVSM